MSKTTTYKADDRKHGFTAGEIADRLRAHHPSADVKVVANWSRRVTLIEVTDPDELTPVEQAGAIYEPPAPFTPYPPRPGTPGAAEWHGAGL